MPTTLRVFVHDIYSRNVSKQEKTNYVDNEQLKKVIFNEKPVAS